MAKYYNIDNNLKVLLLSVLFLLFVPFVGAWFFGTKLTSYYKATRILGGMLAIMLPFIHLSLLLYLVFNR